jgi:hypothetical protein
MTKFAVYVATAFALVALSVPASAEFSGGSPVKNGSQCWKASPNHGGSNGGTFGYWDACPKTASVPVAPASRAKRSIRHARS